MLSRRTHFWNSLQEEVRYTYDGLDRLTSMTAGSLVYRWRYDEAPYQGLLTSILEPGRTVTYAYDSAGRVVSESIQEGGAQPLVTAYEYDAAGRVHEVTYPSGLRVRYERDPGTGEVVRVSNPETGTRFADEVARLPGGPIHTLAFGNGARLDASFNLRHEPLERTNGPLRLTYTPNPAGDVGRIHDQSLTLAGTTRDSSRDYTYDFLDRLTGSPGWLRYFHDGAGNRTSETAGSAQASYSYVSMARYAPRDQVQHRLVGGSMTHTFVYDGAGRTTAIVDWTTPQQLAVCTMRDGLGRLETVAIGNARVSESLGQSPVGGCIPGYSIDKTLVRFRYDASSRRVGRQNVATGQWTSYVHDAAGNLLSERALVNGTWVNVRDYVWLDGAPIAQVEYPGPTAAEGHVYYLHTDHIGLPRAMTNAAGQLVWSTEPRPYGDLVEQKTTDPLSGRIVVTNLRLPGQYDERLFGSLGLQGPYYNWNRWYLPGVGRYLEADPWALQGRFNTRFGVDWYGYADQNPLRNTDPRGLYGTNSCEYYRDACLKYGGKYYCEQGPYWCDKFPKPPDPDPDRDDDYEGWARCTRQCLQDCDEMEHKDDNMCKTEPDNRNGPWDLRYWKPENKSFTCHAACYSWCFSPMGLGDDGLPLRKNPFK